MINVEDHLKLEELRTQVACDKHFTCVESALSDLCQGVYHSDIDILECQQDGPTPCKFTRPFGCTAVCRCPLRKFIAQNFHKWTDQDTLTLRHGQAETLYKQALATREKTLGPNHPDTATTLTSLARLYTAQARYDQAEPLYQRALAIFEKTPSPDPLHTALLLEDYAAMLTAANRHPESQPLLTRAAQLRATHPPETPNPPAPQV